MFLGVALGAFGAHGLKDYFLSNPDLKDIYQTAVFYQMIHGLGMLLASSVKAPSKISWIFLLGILFFSGSLYTMVATQVRWLGAITPIGGVLFLCGWAGLGLSMRSKTL